MIKRFLEHRSKIYVYLIGLVLFSFMLSYALNSISVFLLLLFFFLDKKENIKIKLNKVVSSKIALFYTVFFFIQCFGLLYSDNISFGIKRVIVLLPILFIPAVVLTEKLDRKQFEKILRALKYWIALIFLSLIILHVFINHNSLNTFVLYIIKDQLGISQFYIVFILLIPILYCLKKIEIKEHVIEHIVFTSFFVFCVLLLGNKTSLGMLLLICFIKFLVLYKDLKWYIRVGVFFIATFLILTLAFLTAGLKKKLEITLKSTDFNIETIITKNSVTFTKNTLEHRILINYLALKETKASFPFGVGTGDCQDVLNKNYEKVHFKLGMKQGFNNHNQYLSEFLKTGILGGFCFIVLMFYLIKAGNILDNYYIYLILIFSLGCFFESYLDRQHGVVIFAFLLPLFLKNDERLID